jgi:hypothetical protein
MKLSFPKLPTWLQSMTIHNTYLCFHMLGGGIGGAIGNLVGLAPWVTLSLAFIAAILWEIYEYVTTNNVKVYGSLQNWFFDSLGDVLGATIICALVVCF